MSVIIKGITKPKNCMWMDDNHEVQSCPLLDYEDNCKLQYCKEEWNWADQYAGCPLIELSEHHDSDGNLSNYKVAYSDEMPPTVIEAEE